MSRNYRGVILAIIGTSTIIAGILYGVTEQASYTDRAYRQATDYSTESAKQIGEACFRLVRVEQPECLKEGASRHRLDHRDKRREYEDLIAQKKSALWTMIMGVAALIGMALSSVGVFLVWTTFREQRRATDLAHAEAARAQNASVESDRLAKVALETATYNADSASRAARSSIESNAIAREAMQRQLRPYVYLEGLHVENWTYDGCSSPVR